jgi:uncharacterized protein with gpF-like domain
MDEATLRLSFPEAIAALKSRIPVPSTSWAQFEGQLQDVVFQISGITQVSLLADIQALVIRQLEQGVDIDGFKKNFGNLLDKAGWQLKGDRAYRAELVISQNVRTSYSRGRWEQMRSPAIAKARPYWQFVHRDSRVPRPKHKALDLSVFPANSEVFKAIMPPPWNCKCTVHALSERDLKREGLKVGKPPDLDTIQEPGFGYGFSELPKERERLLKDAKARLPKAFADLL